MSVPVHGNGSNGHLGEYQTHALAVAADLVRVGVPVFVAESDGSASTGYRLPLEWQRADVTSSHRALARWRPGMALCAVMGHTLDLLDFDPHNGSPEGAGFTAWPTPYATAATPSGGQHVFVAALRVGSRDGVLPGVDVKGGRPDGAGRGFAFIAPTVRKSKVDGSAKGYVWTGAPDPGVVATLRSGWDVSGAALAALIEGRRPGGVERPSWSRTPTSELELFRPPSRAFTRDEAWAYCEPWLRALAAAPDGQRNAALNDAAKVCSHFGAEFWSVEEAWRLLLATVPRSTDETHDRSTIASAYRSAERDWRAELVEGARFPDAVSGAAATAGVVAVSSRWVDPEPWLSGTYQPPTPVRGLIRDDGKPLLYPAAWHTVVGSTGTGKSWLAIAHARDELLGAAGRPPGLVAYAHFEESTMGATIARLRAVNIGDDVIRQRFVWLHCNERWAPGEMADQLARLPVAPSLLLLDGINAACTTHGQDPATVAAVGWYRAMFVMPATRLGAAVVSFGHPPKAKDRQDERHGFGSTAWLDEVDGCGFRLVAGVNPIRRGASGAAQLYSVKDRHGGIEQHGGNGGKRDGWTYLGTLVVDNATDLDPDRVALRVAQPRPGDVAAESEPVDRLAVAIVEALGRAPAGRYESVADLMDLLWGSKIRFNKSDVSPALALLEAQGRLERDVEGARKRGGSLVVSGLSVEQPPTELGQTGAGGTGEDDL